MALINEIENDGLTLAQAARSCPGGARNPSTLWRWARDGVKVGGRHIRLEVLLLGKRRYLTSSAALRRFFVALTEARGFDSGDRSESDDESTGGALAELGI